MKSGFSLIEIVIAVGLAAIFLPAVGFILSFALRSASGGENLSKAHRLNQEEMEVMVYLKAKNDVNWDWVTTPVNTAEGEYYQPSQVGAVWQLGAKTKTPVVAPEPFTRKVQINEVRRCGLVICGEPLSPVDPYSRKITTYISWLENGQNTEVKFEAYVTAH